MNIGMIHYRISELDGVSLEMDKWRLVLGQTGHKVVNIAGSLGKSEGCAIPEFALDYGPNRIIKAQAFNRIQDEKAEEALGYEIQTQVRLLKSHIRKCISENQIELLIVNNMFSLPLNIPASLALLDIIKEQKIPVINHNHDFFWERTEYHPSCDLIHRFLVESFPPDLHDFKQVVINRLAQQELRTRRGIDSIVVPNVFYFGEMEDWRRDDYNAGLREVFGVSQNDILILQATRIIRRKGIELTVDILAELNTEENRQKLEGTPLYDGRNFTKNDKIVLILPNLIDDQKYKLRLEQKLQASNLDYRFCNHLFAFKRHYDGKLNAKIYSLWDSYVISDLVSYPSLLEGWGNQFLEALFAKLPIIVFEYDVYRRDIGVLGFEIISLGSEIVHKDQHDLVKVSNEVIAAASQKVIKYLQDPELREKTTSKNYKIGLEKLSLSVLKSYIDHLLEFS